MKPSTYWGVLRAFALGGCVAAAVACDGRSPAARPDGTPPQPRKGPTLAVFDLSEGVPEIEPRGLFGVPAGRETFDDLVDALGEAGRDDSIKGAYVRFGGVSLGIARAQEIGEALGKLRQGGKPVHCHAEGLSNATLYAAAAGCSRLLLAPGGEVDSVGIAAQVVYLRKLLVDELKMSVDILQVGKFKGAEEPLTRDGPSDEARASLEGTLGDIRKTWLEGIAKGRGRDDVALAAEDGPHAAPLAVERGLADALAFEDEAREQARKAVGAVRDVPAFGGGGEDGAADLGHLLKLLAGTGPAGAPVALVRAVGSISMSGGGGPLGGAGGITERELGRVLQRVERDDSIKAVVLRIDSPGGSALASDLLWHRLMRVRKKKPLVVSVGEMAASGGYYLASAGSTIVAEPTSIVGSIGVVGGKVGLGRALERFGIHAVTFPAKQGDPGAANRAAYLSTFTPWDEGTKARVLESMSGVYELFLQRIAEGRNLTKERIEPSAEGRIFSGREAKDRGLVDELGGLSDAIALAKKLAQLGDDARVDVVGGRRGLMDAFAAGDDDEARAPATKALEPAARAAAAASSPLALPPEATELLDKAAPELVPFMASFWPLVGGERALVALPFGISVR